MRDQDIVNTALDNLKEKVGIQGILRGHPNKEVDGAVEFYFEDQNWYVPIVVQHELRAHQITRITDLKYRLKGLMVVAQRIFPKVKNELRQLDIPYLEANGNIFLNHKKRLIWIDLGRPLKPEKQRNRAYTKTGLQVLFDLILNPTLIHQTQREIAELTNVGLGQIHYVLKGLQDDNFLLKRNGNKYVLQNTLDLLNKWIGEYDNALKPKIHIGNFRFLNPEIAEDWKNVELNANLTFWGGEPAGNVLTQYLLPRRWTIYTLENRQDLIKNYRLVPMEDGEVEVYRKFWYGDWKNKKTVPPELVYADLINTFDQRCRETAQKIYDGEIKDRFTQSAI